MCIPCSKTFNAVPWFSMIFDVHFVVTLTLQVDLLKKKLSLTITFETEGLLIVAIYIWLPPASYVVFLTTLVKKCSIFILFEIANQKNIINSTTNSQLCLDHDL